jgi:hypothetical protein
MKLWIAAPFLFACGHAPPPPPAEPPGQCLISAESLPELEAVPALMDLIGQLQAANDAGPGDGGGQ